MSDKYESDNNPERENISTPRTHPDGFSVTATPECDWYLENGDNVSGITAGFERRARIAEVNFFDLQKQLAEMKAITTLVRVARAAENVWVMNEIGERLVAEVVGAARTFSARFEREYGNENGNAFRGWPERMRLRKALAALDATRCFTHPG